MNFVFYETSYVHRRVSAFEQALWTIADAEPNSKFCLCCPQPLLATTTAAFVIVLPRNPTVCSIVASYLCGKCAAGDEGAVKKRIVTGHNRSGLEYEVT